SNSRKVSSGSSDGITAIANKLDSLRRDMKTLKENEHDIQVGCETCGGAHLDKECPLREDVKSIEELKYGEFGRSFPNNSGNNARYRVGTERADMEDWMKKLQESTHMNIRNQNAPLKNLGTQVEQLIKDYQAKTANEVPNSSIGQYKAIFMDNEAPRYETSSNGTNKLHIVSFISNDNV
nr:hypothetical protein [Tanacetum cinerariifolium]